MALVSFRLECIVVSPIHENNKSDEEHGDRVENDAAHERRDVQLLGVVGVLFGLGVLLAELELLGAPGQVHGDEAEERAAAAEDAQPRAAERRVRARRGHTAEAAVVALVEAAEERAEAAGAVVRGLVRRVYRGVVVEDVGYVVGGLGGALVELVDDLSGPVQ